MGSTEVVKPWVLELSTTPGHLVRRAQQVHTSYWAEELNGALTGPQYAVLVVLAGWPRISQTRLGELASLDKNTAADILVRLEKRGWVERVRDHADGRRRVLQLTAVAVRQLEAVTPAAAKVQERLLRPLLEDERPRFVSRLARVAFQQRAVGGYDPRSSAGPVLALPATPGYLIRRTERVQGELWNAEVGAGLTAPQYAVLVVVAVGGDVDQRHVGELASLDRSSTADVVARLEREGWLRRTHDPSDGRRRLLDLTSPARVALEHVTPKVARVQDRLLEPLSADERNAFVVQLAQIAYRGTPPPRIA